MSAAAKPLTQRESEAELVLRHGALVRRIAHYMAARLPASVDVGDLMQAGLIGLTEAARNYDARAGASFETFASIRIRGAMIDEIRKLDWAPRSVHRHARAAAEAIRALEQASGRDARPEEVALKMGLPIQEYHRLNDDAARAPMMGMYAEEGVDPAARVAADARDQPLAILESDAFQKALAKAIEKLPPREQQIMGLYYQDELNLREIGAVLQITESRVCQIHSQALVRVRSYLADWWDEDTGAELRAAA